MNRFYTPKDYLPLSYAYNGDFFHEAVPPCLYHEKLERSRSLPEIQNGSNLIFLLESRVAYPDIGNWFFSFTSDLSGRGPFQSHNGQINFLFADLHVKRLKLAATCTGKLWTDSFPDRISACKDLNQLSEEYR